MKIYSGKTVYITGGSSGIGLAIAKRLSSLGAHVAIFARRKDLLISAAKEIEAVRKSSSQRIAFYQMDVSDEKDVCKVTRRALDDQGAPDILINSAGVAHCDHFEKTTTAHFDHVLKIDLYGPWNVISALLPAMKGKAGRHIVNISSIAGLIGVFGYTAYSAAKFGLIGFSESLRGELKPQGVNVSVLCPPDTNTPQLAEENKTKPEETRAIAGNAGLYQPEQVAEALLKALPKKKFMIIPGMDGKFTIIMKRFLPRLVEFVMDGTIQKVQKRKK